MAITPGNFTKHELIGLGVEVVKSTDPGKIGIKGTVTGESKQVLVIHTGTAEKKIPKKECTFRFALGKEKIDVRGEKLVGRPEERIKK